MHWWGSGLITILTYQMFQEHTAGTGDFELLSNEDFLLLDGTNFLLLGN